MFSRCMLLCLRVEQTKSKMTDVPVPSTFCLFPPAYLVHLCQQVYALFSL